MSILATPWWPDLDPLGTPSAVALALIVGLTILGSWRLSVVAGYRRWVVAAAPLVLLVAMAVTEGSLVWVVVAGGRAFPNADDFTAAVLYEAFGFGFALWNIRLSYKINRCNGVLFSYVYGFLCVSDLMRHLELTWLLAVTSESWSLLFVPGAVYCLVWTPIVRRINRHARHRLLRSQGLCVDCEYDLRGSLDRPACPECGTPTPWGRGR